jgi:hypothetical protein
MKQLLIFLMSVLIVSRLSAQYVYTIKADSVKLTDCDSSELIIENHTQNVPGFLFNTGNGRTIFKHGVQKLNDSLYLVGSDTLKVLNTRVTASNGLSADTSLIMLGQAQGQSGNPAALSGSREIPLNFNTLSITGHTGENASPFDISFQDGNDDFLYSKFQSNSFTRLRIDNTDTGNSAGSGVLLINDAQHLAYFYKASQHNAYVPDGFAIVNNGGTGGLNLVSTPGPITFGNYAGPPYIVGEYARFSNNGWLGLGVQSPTAQLHTTGAVRFAGLTADPTQTHVLVSDASGNLFYRDASTLAANEPIRSSLAVNGPITGQKLTLSARNWPDYVFDSTYCLLSLSDLGKYIQQYHHLPGIPPAAVVEKDGTNVGETQAALLKKIEELTLYAIDQDKKLYKQDDTIRELKEKLEKLEKIIDRKK